MKTHLEGKAFREVVTTSSTFSLVSIFWNSKFDYDCWCASYTLRWCSLPKLMPKQRQANKKKKANIVGRNASWDVCHISHRVDIFFSSAWCENIFDWAFYDLIWFFFLSSFVAWHLQFSSIFPLLTINGSSRTTQKKMITSRSIGRAFTWPNTCLLTHRSTTFHINSWSMSAKKRIIKASFHSQLALKSARMVCGLSMGKLKDNSLSGCF